MTLTDAINILKNERPHCGRKIRYTEGDICEAFDMAIKALEHEPRWIPVSERLPEKHGEYLVTVSSFCGEIVFKCSFAMDLHKVDKYNFAEHKYGFYGIDSEWGSYGINDVIAWMPSPEPYKAESEDK